MNELIEITCEKRGKTLGFQAWTADLDAWRFAVATFRRDGWTVTATRKADVPFEL